MIQSSTSSALKRANLARLHSGSYTRIVLVHVSFWRGEIHIFTITSEFHIGASTTNRMQALRALMVCRALAPCRSARLMASVTR